MSRCPVYRWKSFWLGLGVVAFLGWAWVQSMTWIDGVGWQRLDMSDLSKSRGISVWQGEGRLGLSWDSYDPFVEDGVSYWRTLVDDSMRHGVERDPNGFAWFEADEPEMRREASDPFAPSGADESDPFATEDAGEGSGGMSTAPADARLVRPGDPYEVYARVVDPRIVVFPKALRVEGSTVSVAHWLVVLVFLLAWSGWLVWRWRRMKRLTEVEVRG